MWKCNPTTSLSASGKCECAPGHYYSWEDDQSNFDSTLQKYRELGCVPCTQCALGSYVANEDDECSTSGDRKCSPCPNALPSLGFYTGKSSDGRCDYACPSGYSPKRILGENDMITDLCACAQGFFGSPCKECSKCSASEYVQKECDGANDIKCGKCSSAVVTKPANSIFTAPLTDEDKRIGRCQWFVLRRLPACMLKLIC